MNTIVIGHEYFFFDGEIKNIAGNSNPVAVWNRELSQKEIETIIKL